MPDPHDSTDLDDLVRVIESLQERIRRDGDTIGSNEIRTRTALVDPLLTALGWDTTDPAMVVPEYAAGGGTADYALLKMTPDDGTPVIAFIEAKRLHEPLENHRAQMLTYANMTGVKYAGLTNGDRWELYEVFKEAPLHERRIMDVSLQRERAADCAVKLVALQWASLVTGETPATPSAHWHLSQALRANAAPTLVAELIDHGVVDIKARNDNDETPLHLAVQVNADSQTIKVLLDRGADIEAREDDGYTPLHLAVILNINATTMKLLLAHGADVEARSEGGDTPLHMAATEMTSRLLLDWGANIQSENEFGATPLHYAVIGRSLPVVEVLLRSGADVAARDHRRQTPLHQVTTFPYSAAVMAQSDVPLAKLLLDWGADVMAADDENATPLHRAAEYTREVELIALFLNRGADVRATDIYGRTPLHSATWFTCEPSIITMLIDHRADIGAVDCSDRTPLHMVSACCKESSVIETLLHYGADIVAVDRHGKMPLHYAAIQNRETAITEVLLYYGADINARDASGHTPLYYAAKSSELHEVADLLRYHGATM